MAKNLLGFTRMTEPEFFPAPRLQIRKETSLDECRQDCLRKPGRQSDQLPLRLDSTTAVVPFSAALGVFKTACIDTSGITSADTAVDVSVG